MALSRLFLMGFTYFMKHQFIACFTLLFALQSCSILTDVNDPSNVTKDGNELSDNPTTDIEQNTLDNSSNPPNNNDEQVTSSADAGQFSKDVLFTLLSAEIAASRQQYGITLSQYVKAADATGDLGIISRAARLAQYFRDNDQTLRMGQLWLAQSPDDIEANSIIASAHLDLRQPLKALDYAEHIVTLLYKNAQIEAATAKSVAGAEQSFNKDSQQDNARDDEQDLDENQGRIYAHNRKPSIKQRAAILETIANFSRTTDADTLEKLIQRYHALDTRYPTLTPIKVALSVLYESKKDTEQAFAIVRKGIEQDADYLPAARQEINLFNALGQYEQALEKLKLQLDKTPNNARMRLLYARTLAQTDINAAYKEFTLLSNSAPENLDIKFSKAIIALELRELDDAKQTLTELLNSQYRPDTINYYLGNLAELEKDSATAINYYLKVKGGDDFVAANTQAARLMASLNKLDDAKAHLKTLRNQSPNLRAQIFNAEADILDEQGMTEEAITVLNVAIDEYPNNVSLLYKRSSFYEKTDRLTLMEADLRHALDLEPKNPAILNALGYFLTIRTDRYQEALDLIQQAINVRPEDAAILDSMGWVLFKLGRIEEAISYLRKAFEKFPDPEVAAHLGEALWVNGQQQEALKIWNKNLSENPDDTNIPNTMRRLNAQL
jgi:tetratricopeptide (TPR) repeat protein